MILFRLNPPVCATTLISWGRRRFLGLDAGVTSTIALSGCTDPRDEFLEWVRDTHLFELEGLSEEERAVVEEAIEDGYYEDGTEEGFESLAERFHEHRAIESDEWGGEWLVEYEGIEYLADLSHTRSLVET